MNRLFTPALWFAAATVFAQSPSGDEVLKKVDRNMVTESKIMTTRMVVHGGRESRTMQAKSWQRGVTESFTEFLAPPRDQGTKMLKLNDMLWTFTPSTDRTILISGHMLRQSMMGSDLSYEDMMEDPHLPNLYDARITGEETLSDRSCWILDLTAKKEGITYFSRKIWVDRARFVIVKENLYAKSGKLLKTMDVREFKQIQDHWVATSILYKDVMKEGEGTEFFVDAISLNARIPENIFSKASLRK